MRRFQKRQVRPLICVVTEDAHDLLTKMMQNLQVLLATEPLPVKRMKMLCDNYQKRVEGFTVLEGSETMLVNSIPENEESGNQ
jgi:hypothetical protein